LNSRLSSPPCAGISGHKKDRIRILRSPHKAGMTTESAEKSLLFNTLQPY